LIDLNDRENGRPLLTARGLELIVPVLAMPAEFAPVTEVVVVKELEGEKRRTEKEAGMVESAMAGTAVPVPPPPMAEPLSAVPTMHFLDQTFADFGNSDVSAGQSTRKGTGRSRSS
jgi:hypothetical protein